MSPAPHTWSLLETARRLSDGRVGADEYARALLDRCTDGERLNAFVTQHADQVLAAAHAADRAGPEPARPLLGVPLAVKDNIDVAALPTTGGTTALRRNGRDRSAEVWTRLARAGATALGKTGMDELAYGVTGENAAFGAVENPAAGGHICGGSSAGTAAAVAAGLAPAGLGTDTGGSVRIPAALCGLVGMRPTTGRYPSSGILRVCRSRDTAGIMARSVEDVAFLDALLACRSDVPPRLPSGGYDRDGERPRLLLARAAWAGIAPEVAAAVAPALEALRRAGAVLIDVDLPLPVPDLLRDVALPVPLRETWAELDFYLARSDPYVSTEELVRRIAGRDVADILTPLLAGPVVSPGEYRRALKAGHVIDATARALLREHRACGYLSPSTILPAVPAPTGARVRLPGGPMSVFLAYIRNTALAAVLGWPSISLPAGSTRDGLPVGLLLDSPPYTDRSLLALAAGCARAWRGSAAEGPVALPPPNHRNDDSGE
ncbi:amidase family protein [Actinomadura flavalba]|uniref:amidase family protein n=1 Tax=Actinomadura flavalba TaxID=1120938 RepID=UPI00036E8157|nr:amidase family protein [Actinomadura flavalba]